MRTYTQFSQEVHTSVRTHTSVIAHTYLRQEPHPFTRDNSQEPHPLQTLSLIRLMQNLIIDE